MTDIQKAFDDACAAETALLRKEARRMGAPVDEGLLPEAVYYRVHDRWVAEGRELPPDTGFTSIAAKEKAMVDRILKEPL